VNININDLQNIPGVGPNIAQDLVDIGIKSISDIRDKNPDKLYQKLIKLRGQPVDRCVLYVFRCAAHFASTNNPEPEKSKWWKWKD